MTSDKSSALFQCKDYFHFEAFTHSELFSKTQNVWQALGQIGPYLAAWPHFRKMDRVSERAYLINSDQITIGEGSVIEAGAYIEGPCIIGAGCTIRHGAYIRGQVIIGDRCVVGSELKNAILFDGAKAAHYAYVGDTILGRDVNLGAGVKCANVRFDRGEIYVYCAGQRYPTGRRKFGAVVGDGVEVGCNAVLLPGSLVGSHSRLYPSCTFRGVLPPHSRFQNEK